MSNYKVKVNNEVESREVQGLLEQLGHDKGVCSVGNYPAMIVTTISLNTGNSCSTRATGLNCKAHNNHKELTIPQLKDLVVLKRNDVFDKTHYCDATNSDYFVSSDNVVYFFNDEENNTWQKSNYDLSELKPIIKHLKEYLVPQDNGKYTLTKATEKRVSDWIEVPEGAEVLTGLLDDERSLVFWKPSTGEVFQNEIFKSYAFHKSMSYEEYKGNWIGDLILWQRHTKPEELPFVDDEPKPSKYDSSVWVSSKEQNLIFSPASISSLNDTYAEIEQVRQDNVNNPSHYSDSSIECIDAMEAMMTPEQFIGYLRGNVFKYQWRYEKKNGIEDLKKAQWYLDKLVTKVNEK